MRRLSLLPLVFSFGLFPPGLKSQPSQAAFPAGFSDSFFQADLRWAAEKASVFLSDPLWKTLVEMTRDPDPQVRLEAIRALAGYTWEPRVRERLLELAQDAETVVERSAAIHSLKGTADPEIRRKILALTGPGEPSQVRITAVSFLELHIGLPEIRSRILELSGAPEERAVRRAAILALRLAKSDPEIRRHLEKLLQDPDPLIRQAALISLNYPLGYP
ncbi:MAG: HEAT repeat domain-containing protein [Elusimicrobia bacterium]|nr:HEAT repeat domain-containing protein [Elusimicrobiota bacterium]